MQERRIFYCFFCFFSCRSSVNYRERESVEWIECIDGWPARGHLPEEVKVIAALLEEKWPQPHIQKAEESEVWGVISSFSRLYYMHVCPHICVSMCVCVWALIPHSYWLVYEVECFWWLLCHRLICPCVANAHRRDTISSPSLSFLSLSLSFTFTWVSFLLCVCCRPLHCCSCALFSLFLIVPMAALLYWVGLCSFSSPLASFSSFFSSSPLAKSFFVAARANDIQQ